MRELLCKNNIKCFLLIFLCFLWTSCGYLSWAYHLMDFITSSQADLATEVVGYLFQAAGILLFSIVTRHRKGLLGRYSFLAVMLVDTLLIIASVLVRGLGGVLVLGYVMNVVHGIVAGFYLHRLAWEVTGQHRGLIFGLGYGVASIASYLLSLIGDGNFLRSPYVLVVYALLVAVTMLLVYRGEDTPKAGVWHYDEPIAANLIALAGVTIFLLSLVKNLGFFFPFAELGDAISLEFSRAFYAAGLIAAGIVCDRDRKYAAICCVASLGVPFIMVGLSGSLGPSVMVWILNYCLFGFFTVFRVILFSDMAERNSEYYYLSGLGLLFGRLGDASGSFVSMWLASYHMGLIIVAAVFFAVTIILFFRLYQIIYTPKVVKELNAEEMFENFADHFSLSGREREVMGLLAKGASNKEIEDELFISESTVKYHVHNLLKKTGCDSRMDLVSLYRTGWGT